MTRVSYIVKYGRRDERPYTHTIRDDVAQARSDAVAWKRGNGWGGVPSEQFDVWVTDGRGNVVVSADDIATLAGTTTVTVGSRWSWAGKTWRVDSIDNGSASIVNVDREHNTARLPLTQFRPDMVAA